VTALSLTNSQTRRLRDLLETLRVMLHGVRADRAKSANPRRTGEDCAIEERGAQWNGRLWLRAAPWIEGSSLASRRSNP
jgi:hypothetical protein